MSELLQTVARVVIGVSAYLASRPAAAMIRGFQAEVRPGT
jgi:hypothetical protein